jgi:hypothetical protein
LAVADYSMKYAGMPGFVKLNVFDWEDGTQKLHKY